MSEPRSHLILALDVPDRDAALAAVARLAGHVGCFKLGLEIFTSEGPRLVREIVDRGEKVFLDLKMHDIPNTVAGAVRSACRLGIDMLTLHAAGGQKMLEAALDAARSAPKPPLLLAVTALTSLSADDAQSIGIRDPIGDWAEQLAGLALRAGLSGIVTSPREVSSLRRRFGSKLKLVVPGIRPAGSATQDQARIATPTDAIRTGADFIVVGRPILQAAEPTCAADQIVAEIAAGLGNADIP